MIPLNQLIPECLLALGGAFLLGNLAAYIRLRPAWRDARQARGGQAVKRGANTRTKAARTRATANKPGATGATGGVKAAAPRNGSSRRVSARAHEPTASPSKLPSRTRVLVNVLIGLLITVAALAALVRT